MRRLTVVWGGAMAGACAALILVSAVLFSADARPTAELATGRAAAGRSAAAGPTDRGALADATPLPDPVVPAPTAPPTTAARRPTTSAPPTTAAPRPPSSGVDTTTTTRPFLEILNDPCFNSTNTEPRPGVSPALVSFVSEFPVHVYAQLNRVNTSVDAGGRVGPVEVPPGLCHDTAGVVDLPFTGFPCGSEVNDGNPVRLFEPGRRYVATVAVGPTPCEGDRVRPVLRISPA